VKRCHSLFPPVLHAVRPIGVPARGALLLRCTGLLTLSGWPSGMRVIVLKERPYPGARLRFTNIDGHTGLRNLLKGITQNQVWCEIVALALRTAGLDPATRPDRDRPPPGTGRAPPAPVLSRRTPCPVAGRPDFAALRRHISQPGDPPVLLPDRAARRLPAFHRPDGAGIRLCERTAFCHGQCLCRCNPPRLAPRFGALLR
jgi:hypothetical protein